MGAVEGTADWTVARDRLYQAYAVVRAHRVFIRELGDFLELHRLTVTGMELLTRLLDPCFEEVRMTGLADDLAVSVSGLTRVVDQLVADGLVQRSVGRHSRREVTVRLTEQGRRKVAEALPGYLEVSAVQHEQLRRTLDARSG